VSWSNKSPGQGRSRPGNGEYFGFFKFLDSTNFALFLKKFDITKIRDENYTGTKN
jgi:hypothetical protein